MVKGATVALGNGFWTGYSLDQGLALSIKSAGRSDSSPEKDLHLLLSNDEV